MNRFFHRVHELGLYDRISLLLLKASYFETNLFPNLRVLQWNTQHITSIKYIKPLLCHSLVALDITSYEEDEMTLSSFFKILPSRCPGLTIINLNSYCSDNWKFRDSISRALCTFKTLKRLLVSSRVDDAALRHLLMSSQLEELALAITQNQLAEYSPLPSDTPLRNAKKLDLCLSGLDLIVNLLRPGDQKFSEITIHLFNLDLPHAIGSIFSGLTSRA